MTGNKRGRSRSKTTAKAPKMTPVADAQNDLQESTIQSQDNSQDMQSTAPTPGPSFLQQIDTTDAAEAAPNDDVTNTAMHVDEHSTSMDKKKKPKKITGKITDPEVSR